MDHLIDQALRELRAAMKYHRPPSLTEHQANALLNYIDHYKNANCDLARELFEIKMKRDS